MKGKDRVEKKRYLNISKLRCDAMKDAGIGDAEKQEGIDFCITACPYEVCMVTENPANPQQRKITKNKHIARELRERQVAVDDIAAILSVSEMSVRRYLKK